MARRRGTDSIRHAGPIMEAIGRGHQERLRQRREASVQGGPSLLGPLRTLLSLQEADGRWNDSPQLRRCLALPELPQEPAGMAHWRWVTALASAWLRRHPRYYEATRGACARAEEWSDDAVLALARQALPPGTMDRPNPYALDSASVKDGTWRDHLERTLHSLGHAALAPSSEPGTAEEEEEEAPASSHTPPEPAPEPPLHTWAARRRMHAQLEEELARERRPRARARLERQRALLGREMRGALRLRPVEWGKGDEAECCWRRRRRWEPAARGPCWYPARVLRVSAAAGTADVAFSDARGGREHGVPLDALRVPAPAIAATAASPELKRAAEAVMGPGSGGGALEAPLHPDPLLANRAHTHARSLPALAAAWQRPTGLGREVRRLEREVGQRGRRPPWDPSPVGRSSSSSGQPKTFQGGPLRRRKGRSSGPGSRRVSYGGVHRRDA